MTQKKAYKYVYILCCSDGSLYTGWTTDLQRRVSDHSAGRGGRYFADNAEKARPKLATNAAACARLWEISAELTGLSSSTNRVD